MHTMLVDFSENYSQMNILKSFRNLKKKNCMEFKMIHTHRLRSRTLGHYDQSQYRCSVHHTNIVMFLSRFQNSKYHDLPRALRYLNGTPNIQQIILVCRVAYRQNIYDFRHYIGI